MRHLGGFWNSISLTLLVVVRRVIWKVLTVWLPQIEKTAIKQQVADREDIEAVAQMCLMQQKWRLGQVQAFKRITCTSVRFLYFSLKNKMVLMRSYFINMWIKSAAVGQVQSRWVEWGAGLSHSYSCRRRSVGPAALFWLLLQVISVRNDLNHRANSAGIINQTNWHQIFCQSILSVRLLLPLHEADPFRFLVLCFNTGQACHLFPLKLKSSADGRLDVSQDCAAPFICPSSDVQHLMFPELEHFLGSDWICLRCPLKNCRWT